MNSLWKPKKSTTFCQLSDVIHYMPLTWPLVRASLQIQVLKMLLGPRIKIWVHVSLLDLNILQESSLISLTLICGGKERADIFNYVKLLKALVLRK